MEREIKFRGKNEKGEWKYGSLIQKEKKTINGIIMVTFIAEGLPVGTSDFEFWEIKLSRVEPHTVGQYIGLHDKNGKEIYEGDIIKLRDVGNFYVLYNKERCQFELRDSDGYVDKLWKLNADRYEVIGNFIG